MLYGIPQNIIDQFTARGAKQYSYSVHDDLPFTELIYFWDSLMREVGFVCTIFPNNPEFCSRKWSNEAFDSQKFFPL